VDSLAGAYVTAEDVGVRVEDMKEVAKATRFVSGLSDKGGAGGDPSPYTAKGVTLGIEASVKHALDRTSIEGLTVAVQGLGGVGGNLAQELSKRGARLLVADVDPQKVEAVCDLLGAEPVSVSDVLYEEVDIVAPCALGGAITEEVASKLQARVIAGGANNQIATARAGQILMKRGVTYAPDYVINSGGIILVAAEYFGDNCGDQVQTAIDLIYGRTLNILDRSRASSRFSGDVADEMARAVITAAASGREASVSSSFVAV
jgi:leucine dehydrogenase